MTPEGKVKSQILSYLRFIPRCHVLPISTMGVFDQTKKLYRRTTMIKGTPDIICCFEGRFISIEVKSKVGRLSPHQKLMKEDIERCGGTAIVARCVEDVSTVIGSLKEKKIINREEDKDQA